MDRDTVPLGTSCEYVPRAAEQGFRAQWNYLFRPPTRARAYRRAPLIYTDLLPSRRCACVCVRARACVCVITNQDTTKGEVYIAHLANYHFLKKLKQAIIVFTDYAANACNGLRIARQLSPSSSSVISMVPQIRDITSATT